MPALSLKQGIALGLYRLALPLLKPLALKKLRKGATQAFADTARAREAERLGQVPAELKPGGVMVHGASVGEILAAKPLLQQMQSHAAFSPLTITCMTATGSEQITQAFDAQHCFMPLDFPSAVDACLDKLAPRALIILETEIWPNLMHACAKRQIPVYIINARLSPSNFNTYTKIRALIAPALATVAEVWAQSDADADKFRQLGATNVITQGNLKFDIRFPATLDSQTAEFKALLGDSRPIWLAASTHPGEEEQVLAAHKQLLQHNPRALLILVPRHPQRFDQVAELVISEGLTLARRSHNQSVADEQVLLIDAMGELLAWFGLCPVSFIGGSLVDVGGHNPIEAVVRDSLPITGPVRYNFDFVYPQLLENKGAIEVNNSQQLAQTVSELWGDDTRRADMLIAANTEISRHQGVLERTLQGLVDKLATRD